MKKTRAADNIVLKGFAIFVMAFLGIVYFFLFLHGLSHYEEAQYLYSFEQKGWIVVLCGISVFFFWLLYLVAGAFFSKCGKKTLKIVYVLICFGVVLLQGYFLFYIRSYYEWDAGWVVSAAASLAEEGRVAEGAVHYVSIYPNQNTFVLITSLLIKLGNIFGIKLINRPLLLNIFNTICLDGAMLLTFPVLKKSGIKLPWWKRTRILLLMACNPFLYLGVAYYYTMTLSLPFMQGFLYFALSTLEEKGDKKVRMREGILGGILLGIGYEMRATGIIFAIAFGMVFLGKTLYNSKKLKDDLILFGILGLTACIAAGSLSEIQKAYIGIDTTDTAFPTAHWVMMSLTMPGEYNEEDEFFTASYGTKEEKKTAVMKRMREKLGAMNAEDLFRLIQSKLTITFGNGSNGCFETLKDALGTEGIYEWVFGSRNDLTILWHQGYYLFVLLGVLMGCMNFVKKILTGAPEQDVGNPAAFFFLGLILVGALLFYVLWEAGEQYSIPFMAVMWSTAIWGYDTLEKMPIFRERQAKILSLGAFAAASLIGIWGILRYGVMTQVPLVTFQPVAVQHRAHGSYIVTDEVRLIQEIQAKKPFNRLALQWRNPVSGENTSVYHLTLIEEGEQRPVFETDIIASDSGYHGAGVYNLEEMASGNGIYDLMVEKTAGRPEDNLSFVCFDIYGYQAYPAGNFYIEQNGQKTQIPTSLLFELSKGDISGYMTKKSYIVLLAILFLIFLFAGFWCKLRVVPLLKEENRNEQKENTFPAPDADDRNMLCDGSAGNKGLKGTK
ncbi:MAG: hypothetical protein J1E61_00200 [Lachnospiraceae bacterium]|nr:hypothetical protein [Lachnospiraceae bacterium]